MALPMCMQICDGGLLTVACHISNNVQETLPLRSLLLSVIRYAVFLSTRTAFSAAAAASGCFWPADSQGGRIDGGGQPPTTGRHSQRHEPILHTLAGIPSCSRISCSFKELQFSQPACARIVTRTSEPQQRPAQCATRACLQAAFYQLESVDRILVCALCM